MYTNLISILSYLKFNLIPAIYSFALLEHHYRFLINVPKSKLTLIIAIDTFLKNLNYTNHIHPLNNQSLNEFHYWVNISCMILTIFFYYNRRAFWAFLKHIGYTCSVEFVCVMISSFINDGLL